MADIEYCQGENAAGLAAAGVPDDVTDHFGGHEPDVVERGMTGQDGSHQCPQCGYNFWPPWDHGHGQDPSLDVHASAGSMSASSSIRRRHWPLRERQRVQRPRSRRQEGCAVRRERASTPGRQKIACGREASDDYQPDSPAPSEGQGVEHPTINAAGDLGTILRFYRRIHGLNQTELGCILGYDKTYISALEVGSRALNDVGSLRRACELLRLPPHVLGITDPADSDHRAMLQFGESTIRLADIARQSGHASEAVAELWPLAVAAGESLESALREALLQRLPHQLQRIIRVAGDFLPDIRVAASRALDRLREEIAA